jgi:N6-L-threonylcarbamoyladenine synthase
MRILGIESSCDETAIALVKEEGGIFIVEKNLISSQIDIHAKYGGVIPEVAAREHVSAIFALLVESGISKEGSEIDVISVTSGPGLVPALRIGVELAKTLAWAWDKPLVGANHLEGHIYSVWLDEEKPQFPALTLLVSGGHTELILMTDHGKYEKIGSTRDDAAGEAFDKVAKMLGEKYPGGPKISKLAESGKGDAIDFPRPMAAADNFDFSFSGLKTAVKNHISENPNDSKEDIAASFQTATVDVLTAKTLRAIKQYSPKSVILTGGVSASKTLRGAMRGAVESNFKEVTFHNPAISLSGDNAVMIAIAGFFNAKDEKFTDPVHLEADPNLKL